ncbi:membrane bound C2 domain protein [Blumeria hordei DH14]|uniref:Membrane bound C2 domain protein n=1 Tax=Blumeria graminis f. sp. hordei (strain DH14) TaxID=546991 RepID=N1JJ46_BLUG1|nr:membrane bound C2 domain protein [Blumeria hordei DH14]
MSTDSSAREQRAPDAINHVDENEHKNISEAETQESNVVTYSFDPDATPQEKAAQARARVPARFHHQQESLAAPVVTDIDDGTLTRDLPPQIIANTSKAPGPTKNKESNLTDARVSGPEDDIDEEDKRWIERAGWAPRFGNPCKVEIEEQTPTDHQTWVEGHLDDKFFGDWYHNTAVIIFSCLASWLVATLGGGLAWVFLIIATCGTYYRTSLRRVRRNFRDDICRELAINRLETDTESLEWINSFLVKFWPIFQPVFAESVINSVDQVLSTSTPSFLDSLRMKTFTLGSKPPRMEHVKTYPKAEDDIILMDWKFSFNPMDKADMTSRQIKNQVNPKVVLEIRIGKAMISKGLDVIVEDMAFSGLMRIKIKLQIPFPHVERIEFSLLEKPHIDYVCKPLGGETLGFDINFIPGLESFILDQIHANIGPMMYSPNVFPIEVAQMMNNSAIDQALGVLAITLHGAQGLKNPDKFAGTPDPYVLISINGGTTLAQTKTVKEDANPKWNETKYVIITTFTDTLTLEPYDYNEFRKDKKLGTVTFPLEKIKDIHEYPNEHLEVVANGKSCGIIMTDIKFFPVLKGLEQPDGNYGPPPESNTGIAKITVEQAKDLDGTKSLIGQLNPYAVLLLNNKEIHVTRKLKRTNNPIWENGSKDILITDRKSAKIGLVIKDDRELSTDPVLGTFNVKLDDILQFMEKGQEWFNLMGVKTGRAKLTLQWKPVALTGAELGTGGYVTPVGVMRFHFKSARKLRNLETLGKSDPYVRVLLSGIQKGRTVTFKNNLNPDWDEIIYIPVHKTSEKITLEVMDEESIGHDRSLGKVEILASEYMLQDQSGEFLARLPTARIGELCMHGKGSPRGFLNYTVAFYPCLNVADIDEPEDKGSRKNSLTTNDETIEKASIGRDEPLCSPLAEEIIDSHHPPTLVTHEKNQLQTRENVIAPVFRLTSEELLKYESGLVVFKFLEVEVQKTNVHLEVLMDDMLFPSYSSSLIRSRKAQLSETGDCFVRELDFSKITLRIREKGKNQGDEKRGNDQTLAKLTGKSRETLQQCLNNPTTLSLTSEDGSIYNVSVVLKFIPVKMDLDPCESINNMGKLRVDVLDALELPSADRNGFSDPYCKFELNGKDVHKTKVQKKTLHPVWNESFEVDIASRTAAQFKCTVFDWDLGDKADLLGLTTINLASLEPLKVQECNLELDGKSGSIRLRLLFTPGYVIRTRQGSSSISGTFAAPGRIVTGVAGAPIKGVGFAAHGVGKGASFIRNGFKAKKKTDDEINTADQSGVEPGESTPTLNVNHNGSRRISGQNDGPPISFNSSIHGRTKSFAGSSIHSTSQSGFGTNVGTATFTILSASGYPPSTNLIIHFKMLGPRTKTLHRTEHIKSPTGEVSFDDKKETFKCICSADTRFQIVVKDHKTFGSDDDLGECLFFVDESGTGADKQIKVGNGIVVIKSNFNVESEPLETNPRSASGGFRRSLLGKLENGRGSRDTPSPTLPLPT